jgi:hypothetical protein
MEMSQTQPAAATYTPEPGYFRRLSAVDWLYGFGLLAAVLFALHQFGAFMDA